jgi:hypothetical protein
MPSWVYIDWLHFLSSLACHIFFKDIVRTASREAAYIIVHALEL